MCFVEVCVSLREKERKREKVELFMGYVQLKQTLPELKCVDTF